MTARAMSDEQIDAAVLAAYDAMPGSPIDRAGDPLWRAIYRAAYAAATRDTAELCAAACEEQARKAGDGMTFYTATGQCAAACRKVGEA